MIFLFENFAESRLEAGASSTDLVLVIPAQDSVKFPKPTNAEHRFALVLFDGIQDPEICWASANPLTGNLSVERGAEGTGAKIWRAGTAVINAPTKVSLDYLASGGSDSWHQELLLMVEEAYARITTETQLRIDGDGALANRIDTVETGLGDVNAAVNTIAQAFSGISTAWAQYQIDVSAQTADAVSKATQALNTSVENGQATAELKTFVETAVGNNAAVFAEKIQAFTDFDEAQVQINTDVESRVGTAEANLSSEILLRTSQYDAQAVVNQTQAAQIGANTADILTETTTRAGETSALASRSTALESEVGAARGGQGDLKSRIDLVESTAASDSGALATRTSTLEAQMVGTTASGLKALVTTEESARVAADSALASRATTLEAQMLGSTSSGLKALVTTEESARVAADSALASRSTTLEAQVAGTTASGLKALITTEESARISGDSALATRSTTLEAKLNIKQNLLKNPTAMNGLVGWTSLGLPVIADTFSQDGSRFICFPGVGSALPNLYSAPFPIASPAGYSLQAEVYMSGRITGAVRVYVAYLSATDVVLAYQVIETFADTAGWVRLISENFISPVGATKASVHLDTWSATFVDGSVVAWRNIKLENSVTCSMFTDERTEINTLARVTTSESAIANAGGLDAWWEVMAIAGSALAGIKAHANSAGGSQIAMVADAVALFNTVLGVAEEVLKAELGNVFIKKNLYLGDWRIVLEPAVPSITFRNGVSKVILGPNFGEGGASFCFWMGRDGVPVTVANAAFSLGTDGNIYRGYGTLNINTPDLIDLAVTGAKIGDLQVDTIKIANYAVSDSIVAYTAGSIGVGSSGAGITNLQTCTITVLSGERIDINVSAVFRGVSGPSGGKQVQLRILRDGVVVFSVYTDTIASTLVANGNRGLFFSETPGTGTVTYTFQEYHGTDNSGTGGNIEVRYMKVARVKR